MSQKEITTRIVVLYEPDYPQTCSEETIASLVPGECELVRASALASRLDKGCDLFISFHGPYFPRYAWKAILHFLQRGGNLAVFGGMPFTRPVDEDGQVGLEQQAYTDQLYLGPFFPLEVPETALCFVASPEARFLREVNLYFPVEQPGKFWSFYPMLTQVSDHTQDLGSGGPFDTLLTPLLFVQQRSSLAMETIQRLATPALLLDQQSGVFQGGRWLLSPWQPATENAWLENAAVIQQLLLLTTEGATSVDVHPLEACYLPGETPSLQTCVRTMRDLNLKMRVLSPEGEVLQTSEFTFAGLPIQQEARTQLPVQSEPGLYRVEIEYGSDRRVTLGQQTGFWVWDEALVAATADKRLVPGRDYFYQNGELFPIFGTTYMDSRVQRRFLTLPNPARWDTDFAAMSSAGINMIRTGIWTALRTDVMPLTGVARESALRAFDAFVMTACKYNIQVIFTFFTFFPALFEGENPWLDPRSLQGQRDFVVTFARRYAKVHLVSWDLINEPSFGAPSAIFSQRPLPNYDRFEVAAFRSWLAEQYTLEELQTRWRMTPVDLPDWEHVQLPVKADYSTDVGDIGRRHMLRVMDYTFFSQDMFAEWATFLYQAIRTAGSQTLVGVGQDEAGSRIAPQFYASVVDYTTTHPWWNLDDLLWDMVMDKTAFTPNLIQETGVMIVRDVDMRPWRTEQECAYLLERKLITGLIARGAGLIQWLWHINSYMKNENENSIGLVRPDGSVKPELAVMLEFGRLMQALHPQLMESSELPDVWLVAPYSQWFLRPELAIESTRQVIRRLGYDLGIIPQVVGEEQLAELAEDHQPRMIIVPAVQSISQSVWETLERVVARGATLLVSGVLTRDQHHLPIVPGFLRLTEDEKRPLALSRYEVLEDEDGETYQLRFGNGKIGYVRKAHNRLKTYSWGEGRVIWSGLPLELSENPQVVRRIYQRASGNVPLIDQGEDTDSPLLLIKRQLKDGVLFLGVSENSTALRVTLSPDIRIEIAPNRAGAVIVQNNGDVSFFGGIQPVI